MASVKKRLVNIPYVFFDYWDYGESTTYNKDLSPMTFIKAQLAGTLIVCVFLAGLCLIGGGIYAFFEFLPFLVQMVIVVSTAVLGIGQAVGRAYLFDTGKIS